MRTYCLPGKLVSESDCLLQVPSYTKPNEKPNHFLMVGQGWERGWLRACLPWAMLKWMGDVGCLCHMCAGRVGTLDRLTQPQLNRPPDMPPPWLLLPQFNARSESVHEKPSFKRLLPTRRCEHHAAPRRLCAGLCCALARLEAPV